MHLDHHCITGTCWSMRCHSATAATLPETLPGGHTAPGASPQPAAEAEHPSLSLASCSMQGVPAQAGCATPELDGCAAVQASESKAIKAAQVLSTCATGPVRRLAGAQHKVCSAALLVQRCTAAKCRCRAWLHALNFQLDSMQLGSKGQT